MRGFSTALASAFRFVMAASLPQIAATCPVYRSRTPKNRPLFQKQSA
ncbi:MAG: hypothetical protein JNK92_09625 [Dechloromonas sp.]|nr:hypothetical protein [Dechloromonas sp.]